jgi:hypothetical protein
VPVDPVAPIDPVVPVAPVVPVDPVAPCCAISVQNAALVGRLTLLLAVLW